MNNPDLLQPNSSFVNSVSPLVALTKPLGNTKVPEARYYYCTMDTASFHRPDGKKLPFIHHFFKTSFAEDIAYLDNEINGENPYIRAATAEEVEQAKLMEDPLGTVKEAVKNELTIAELEALLEARRNGVEPKKTANVITDAAKIGGVDAAKVNVTKASGVNAVSAASLSHMLRSSGK